MPHECTGCGRQFADGSKEMLSGCPDCGGSKFQFMPAGGAPAAEEPPEPPGRAGGAVAETVGAATTRLRDFVSEDAPAGAGGAASMSEDAGDAASRAEDAGGTGAPTADRERDQGAAPEQGTLPGGPGETDSAGSPEDGAQSAARSEMVTQEELPGSTPGVGSGSSAVDADSATGAEMESPAETGSAWPTEAEAGSADGAPREDAEAAAVEGEGDLDAEPSGRVVDTPSEESPDLSELREELNDQFEGIRICERGEYELNLMELYEREETIIALQENGRYVIEPPESWHGDD
jgi:predicted  nucleic acid-binding Zn-ribbon protein